MGVKKVAVDVTAMVGDILGARERFRAAARGEPGEGAPLELSVPLGDVAAEGRRPCMAHRPESSGNEQAKDDGKGAPP
jgi:hypothetical protein